MTITRLTFEIGLKELPLEPLEKEYYSVLRVEDKENGEWLRSLNKEEVERIYQFLGPCFLRSDV